MRQLLTHTHKLSDSKICCSNTFIDMQRYSQYTDSGGNQVINIHLQYDLVLVS